ncbi:MAG TPA: endopeptidase La [Bacilli bacterium]|jgi:ATP-dependent Lon protease|nr:MAG: Lon protease 1 [Tenericutes bacterium ADurb.Bin140]HON64625.1 endopeptidase La [Bacilli bacterium]HOR95821.1 endopeptidase La [Bacilli bacterium]HPD12477.1 endopeptidase La [Bacilli bacterium]HPK58577.1 endopeptidase La [Bacilli bacterium]
MFNETNPIRTELPGLAVRGVVPLPNNEIRLDVGRGDSLKALKAAEQYQNYVVLLVQEDPAVESPTEEELNPIGVIARITLNMTLPNNIRRVKLQSIIRCKINSFVSTKPHFMVDVESLPSVPGNPDEEYALVNMITNELNSDKLPLTFENREALNILNKGVNGDQLTDIIAFNLNLEFRTKMRYLNTTSVVERLHLLLEDIKKQKYFADIEVKIDSEVKKSISESQKEYYLREKMRVIQDELGERVKKDSDVEMLRKKILEAKMPPSMEEKALNELNRYITTPSNSAESSVIRTYLDFVISLPWSKESSDCDDIVKAKQELDADHYGLDKVKERILEYLAVKIMTKKNPQAILCLVGPPGVGKTSLARSIAKALNRQFVKQALGGVKDEAEIRGHRRTYLGALPGRILQAMKKAGTINPVFLLDEIDKMSSDFRGDPTSAMLEVLDAEQNRYFSDHYLEEPYDLSKVFFICTANYLGNIPAPLRDRLEIVELSSYTEFEKFEIARQHLLPKQLSLHGLKETQFSITDQSIYTIIQSYTRESGVRELERLLGTIIRRAIKKILMEKVERVDVSVDNLEEYLGKPKFVQSKADEDDQVGVVTGLAYTAFGGDTLQIEVTHYKGDGKLVLTGKLGDVMKESAQAALSYVKTNCDKFGIDFKLFKENDIHIHVPEGAIPKDGPSAGVTIAIAIISAFSGVPVNHLVGMTGEITLRGRVLPIGGIREKSIAAHRSGLTTILIPKDNLRDLDEIPESVRASLEIIPIASIGDAVEHALIKN